MNKTIGKKQKGIILKTKNASFLVLPDKIVDAENKHIIRAKIHNGCAVVGARPFYQAGGWGRSSRGDIHALNRWCDLRELCNVQNLTLIDRAYPDKDIKKVKQDLAMQYVNERNTNVLDDLSLLCKTKKELKDLLAQAIKKYTTDINKHSKSKKLYVSDPTKAISLEDLKAEQDKNLSELLSGKLKHLQVKGITQAIADKKGNILVNAQKIDTPLDAYLVPKAKTGMNVYQYQLEKLASKKSTKQKISFLPLNVLSAAKLNLAKTKVLDRGAAQVGTFYKKEYKKGPRKKRHFTGALLIENNSQQFLFDLDQREVEHGIFNQFLAKLPKKCKTIDEAYKSLMPAEVIAALEAGTEVKRQGEFFFINTNKKLKVNTSKNKLTGVNYLKSYSEQIAAITDTKILFDLKEFNSWGWSSEANFTRLEIRLGNGRPNHALALPSTQHQFAALAARFVNDQDLPDFLESIAKKTGCAINEYETNTQIMAAYREESAKLLGLDPTKHYAIGTVTHSGREHAPLDLGTTAEIKNTTGRNDIESYNAQNALNSAAAETPVKLELQIWQIVPNTSTGNFTITGDID